jgi:S-DNA-T family DNA segregation ATPase FtsK/SpoIIIE
VTSNISSIDRDQEMYDKAVMVVLANRCASTWLLERHLLISQLRATRLLDAMESRGVVGPGLANGERKVLLKREASVVAD